MEDQVIENGDQEDQVAPNQADAAIEERARRMGWRPKEEFRGPEDQWTDARTFVERGEAALPVLRERYRALDDRFANMERSFGETKGELQNLRQVNSEMREVLNEFRTRASKAEEISYARARGDLEARMAIAVEQADREGYNRAKGELDRINAMERENASKPPARQEERREERQETRPQTQIDPVIAQWVEENPWFKTDAGMAAYATGKFQQLRTERPGASIRDQLDEIKADVKSRFPDKFENPRRNQAAAVGNSSPPASPNKKGPLPFNQWPRDAQEGYRRFKTMMPDYKEEEYAKIYFAGDDR